MCRERIVRLRFRFFSRTVGKKFEIMVELMRHSDFWFAFTKPTNDTAQHFSRSIGVEGKVERWLAAFCGRSIETREGCFGLDNEKFVICYKDQWNLWDAVL